MIRSSLKAKILVFAVFFIGIATGILITNFYEARVAGTRANVADGGDRARRAQRNVERVHDYLELDQEQRERVNRILEEMRTEVGKLRRETQPRFRAIEDQYRSRIREEVLTAEQRQKYDELMKNQEERRNRDRNSDRDRAPRPY